MRCSTCRVLLSSSSLHRTAAGALAATVVNSNSAHSSSNAASFAASRLGLDPSLNRFHAPIVYHENYSFDDWPPNYTFPMDKFEHLRRAVLTKQSHLPRALVHEESDMFRALDFGDVPIREWLAEPTGPLDPDFLDRFLSAQLTDEEKRYIGFREQTGRPELIERTVLEVAGTVLACQLACEYGIASNLAGGTHHAHRTMGAGYTILNDLAVAANFLTSPSSSVLGIERVLVVDCDVHQGDGTAKFTQLHDEQRLFTLSIHCASNYPRPKAQSTIDVGVADGINDEEYMEILTNSLNQAIVEIDPDFILYDAGVDIYEKDKLGRLKVSEAGIRQRDRFVVERCVQAGIPVAAVIGGGYDKDAEALARRHAIVHEECAYIWRKYQMWKRETVK
jgi:acetoin utilization deacetylase AcuC-like enzyme